MSNQVEEKIDKLLNGFYNFEKRTDENFSKLSNRMDSLEGRMDNLENRMDNLENRMDGLENTVNDMGIKMDSRFDNLEKRVRSIKGIVGENMADIADINRRLGQAN